MKKLYFFLLIITPFFSVAQNVGIGTATPDNSAMLDVTSTNGGLLIPRMTNAQRLAIASPATGLLVYDTDKKGFWYYNGTIWGALETTGKERSVYIPGSAFSYATSSFITRTALGITLADNAPAATFIIPKPVDWDSTKPFTVILNFSLPSNTTNTFIIWRLLAESVNINSVAANASTGWDSYNYYTAEDAPFLIAPAASAGYGELAKSQSWTAKYSGTYNTNYFGSGVTTNNDFSGDPIWRFSFQRGRAASNGETYTGNITITGATIRYSGK